MSNNLHSKKEIVSYDPKELVVNFSSIVFTFENKKIRNLLYFDLQYLIYWTRNGETWEQITRKLRFLSSSFVSKRNC